MARAADFRLSAGFRTHPKVMLLEMELGEAGPLSWISIIAHAAQYKPDGILSNMEPRAIALVAHWKGDPDKLITALKTVRLLDETDGVLSLHDWAEHNGYAASYTKRSERGREAAGERWKRFREQKEEEAPVAKPVAPDPLFERAFSVYPKRLGGHSKPDALKAWRASLKRGIAPDVMTAGAEKYAKFVRAEGNEGTNFVMEAKRFFGPGENWTRDWTTNGVSPGGPACNAQPKNATEILKEAAAHDSDR